MTVVVLDACGVLNLDTSGRFVPILAALPHEWRRPAAVEREAQHYRRPDPDDPEKLIVATIDLAPAFEAGVLERCDCEGDAETELYVKLAARIGDDGESMRLALAARRGGSILTEDRKAQRIAAELGAPTLATPEVMKAWADLARPTGAELAKVLGAIERFGNFLPGRRAPEYDGWTASARPVEG